jgi:hypothetical protein
MYQIEGLPDKIIQYDVSTRWNSIYIMLSDGIIAREQIDRFLQLESIGLPAFTIQDWIQLGQLRDIFNKFNEFTLLVSKSKPQLSLSIALYYELVDFFQDAQNRQGLFVNIDESIIVAIQAGLAKYQKYYAFVDELDIYYIAMILDPRFKCELLKQELEDQDATLMIINQLRAFLHRRYLLE